MDHPLSSQAETAELPLKSTSKKTERNQTPAPSQIKGSQKPTYSDVTVKSVSKSNNIPAEIKEEVPKVQEKLSEHPKSIEKVSKSESLKSKNSAKLSQRQKQMEKDQLNSATLKALGTSEKSLKEGHNNISSNVREYSNREEREDLPVIAPKKITTESKKSKLPQSENKAKTESKDPKEEKSAIVSTGKRSTRRSGQEASLPDTVKEEKEEVEKSKDLRSKSKKSKEEEKDFVAESKKRSRRKSEDLAKEIEEKEELKQNPIKSAVKSSNVKDNGVKGVSHVKTKQSKSAMKSKGKSGIKKVKVDPLIENKGDD